MRRVVVDIFEGEDTTPVLSHTAYGQTTAEALDIITAHRQYDAFLDAGLDTQLSPGIYAGTFKGIHLHTVLREE